MNIAVSACLLGEPCRYDGMAVPCSAVDDLRSAHQLLPICPELAGGLDAPRPPCEIVTRERALRVLNVEGQDVTVAFMSGAQATLASVRAAGCKLAILKAQSPTCGNGIIYDGTFTGTHVAGYGVAARLLREEGIRVLSDLQLQEVLAASRRRHPDAPLALFAESSGECPVLETERLVLRALGPDDAPDVFAYCSDPDIGADAGWPLHRTLEDSRLFVTQIANAPHVFGIFEKRGESTGPCRGSVGLIDDPHRKNVDCLMLGYALAKEAWGRGLMTEAVREVISYGFEELGLGMVTVNHYAFNQRSRRVIEKCGFRLEGTLRGAEPGPDGMPQDMTFYSLGAEEWRGEGL
ncbi:MAG: GNAT family N-acetyltransferase [Gordonibacter sp.]